MTVNLMKHGGLFKVFAAVGVLLLAMGGGSAAGQNASDSLKEGFENPPQSARPQAWWHWINDNVTEEGITADLETGLARISESQAWMIAF